MYKIFYIFIFLFSFGSNDGFTSQVKIKLKIDGEIITNLDILDEKNYLLFLRPELNSLPENELMKIAENSLIREIIKQKELDKIFKNINNENFLKDIKKRIFKLKNVDNEEEFINLTKKSNVEYKKVLRKIEIEGLWNELIFRKYNNLVKIDKDRLKNELIRKISNKKRYEYNLSEILFDLDNNETYENKFKKIKNFIKENDFKSAAIKFSLSNSASRGGEIGWVKETLLSAILNDKLKNLKNNQILEPIKYPDGFLMLRLNKKKEMKQSIDINKELNERIIFERNRQLNQFSLLYYKKLKQNTKINEY